MMKTVEWFVETHTQTGLEVCQITNKFLLTDHEVQDGDRDVSLNVLFEAANGVKIISDIGNV
jgi:hypothetical protein